MHFNDDNWKRAVATASLFVFSSIVLGTQRAHADEIYLCEGRRVVIVTEANRQEMRKDPCVSSWRAAMPSHGKQIASVETNKESRHEQGPSPLASLVDHNVEKAKVRGYRGEMKITLEKPKTASKKSRQARSDRNQHGLRRYGDGIWAQ